MKKSKRHLQSNELWFQKANYAAEWLSEESKKIVEQIKNKDMKKFIFTLLFPIFALGQTYYDNALQFQNTVRNYYDAPLLSYNNDLALEAQAWAEYLAETDTFTVSSDNYGENIFYINRMYAVNNNKDVLLEATLNWIIDPDDWSTFNQIVYPEATNVGFGIAENKESIYVVAKYNKLYE
jgi:hypothetical protein